MRRRTFLGVTLASLAGVAACGDTEEPDVSAPDEGSEEESPSPTESESESAPTAGGATVLMATVGTPDDPDAFEIALTDEAGEPVTTLPAGDYSIQVSDPSTIHNFHLTGGSVEETTSVPETEEATWEVTLEAGEYTYVCDPHPPMTGSFTVT